jgi:hypothetical protein
MYLFVIYLSVCNFNVHCCLLYPDLAQPRDDDDWGCTFYQGRGQADPPRLVVNASFENHFCFKLRQRRQGWGNAPYCDLSQIKPESIDYPCAFTTSTHVPTATARPRHSWDTTVWAPWRSSTAKTETWRSINWQNTSCQKFALNFTYIICFYNSKYVSKIIILCRSNIVYANLI